MSGFNYTKQDLEYFFSCNRIEENIENGYVTLEDERKQIPEQYVVRRKEGGANYDALSLGLTHDEEWVIIKPGDLNEGAAVPAHQTYRLLSEYIDFNMPALNYDEENNLLILQHLGELKHPVKALDNSTRDDFITSMAVKALAGDFDVGGNVGFKKGNFYVYDFENAGNSIRSVEKHFAEYLDYISSLSSQEINLKDVESRTRDIANQISLDKFQDHVEQFFETEEHDLFDEETLTYNIRTAKEGEIFSHGFESSTEYDVIETDNSLKNQNINELMRNH